MEKLMEVLNKIWEVLKRIGAVIADVCRRAWELIRQYAPILWAVVCRFCKKAWNACRQGTARLLNVDEQLNRRAVNITLCSFAAIIILFILVLAT